MRSATLVMVSAAVVLAAAGCAGKEPGGQPPIKIGLVGPLTGPLAVLGVSQQNSIQVEIDKLNASGGLAGATFELVARDSGLDPGKAVQAARELAGDTQVKLVVGPSLTAFYNAAKATFEQAKKVNCQPGVAAGDFGALKYGFRSQDPTEVDVSKAVEYLRAKGIKSFGLIYEADDTGKAVDALLTKLAGDMAYLGFQTSRPDDQSHSAYVEKFKDAGAIFFSNNVGGAKTIAAAAAAGFRGQLIGAGSGAQNIAFLEGAGDAARGVIFQMPNYRYPTRDRVAWEQGYRAHIEAVEQKYGINTGPKTGATSPKGTGMAGDCVFAFAEAAKAAGSLEPDKVVAAIERLNLAADSTPSGNSVSPGTAHEFYGADDVRLYQWDKDDKGWFTRELR
ncbi:ABC transporter substrate-binding protein [Streptosporangium roseum]|uniref:ABC transporter substrate-binding protein n=1 Tax=Streptosporangium roseum TaxID=2001 RepID=UPI0012DE64D7|nr:ABC transporter substrate-binding protein [Streptosporangium roseum]